MASRHEPYSVLAEIYDEVMAHVDYDRWAEYVEQLFVRYDAGQGSILELGCGTGSLAVRLAPSIRRPYVASDNSPSMLAVAREKLASLPDVRIKLVDFRRLAEHVGPERFNTVILTYDGINYARDADDLELILDGVRGILETGGLFLFDQTTPANSINNLPYFGDEFEGKGFSYRRTSSYDRKSRTHTTRFVIRREGSIVSEYHEQRAFTRNEMLEAVTNAGLEVVDSFEAFSFERSDEDSERIQWVTREPDSTAKGGGA